LGDAILTLRKIGIGANVYKQAPAFTFFAIILIYFFVFCAIHNFSFIVYSQLLFIVFHRKMSMPRPKPSVCSRHEIPCRKRLQYTAMACTSTTPSLSRPCTTLPKTVAWIVFLSLNSKGNGIEGGNLTKNCVGQKESHSGPSM